MPICRDRRFAVSASALPTSSFSGKSVAVAQNNDTRVAAKCTAAVTKSAVRCCSQVLQSGVAAPNV